VRACRGRQHAPTRFADGGVSDDRSPHHTETTRAPPVDAVAVVHPIGVVEPLHSLYRRESLIGLQKRLSNTAGPRRLLAEIGSVSTVLIADVPAEIPVEPPAANINTVAELERLRRERRPLSLTAEIQRWDRDVRNPLVLPRFFPLTGLIPYSRIQFISAVSDSRQPLAEPVF